MHETAVQEFVGTQAGYLIPYICATRVFNYTYVVLQRSLSFAGGKNVVIRVWDVATDLDQPGGATMVPQLRLPASARYG